MKRLFYQLRSYQERYNSRSAEVERFCQLIEMSERCACRDYFDPGHLTGSAWVVDESSSRVLLLHHGKLKRWLQPGGHADGEFDLASVALRETREESGLTRLSLVNEAIFDIDIHQIPSRGSEPAHLHFDVRYLVRADSSEQLVLSHESRDLAWIEVEQLQQYTTEESVLRMARNAIGCL